MTSESTAIEVVLDRAVSEVTGTRVFDLLPAVYRQRDAEQGRVLQALLSVVERELTLLEADVARLYDDWFIETCEEWV
ncbi:MAG TPA: hypothetical protein VNN79_09110, partial [Actinomycetota bacterium]|nr:hypothetical protein [Actinomycetota bacterium]